MTNADKPAFLEVVKQLALALREPPLDSAQLRVYFTALITLEIEWITRAAKELTTTAKFFPKPSEWRSTAIAIAARLHREQKELLREAARHGTPLCLACGDQGFQPVAADWSRVRPCDCRSLRRLELLGRRPWPQLSGESQPEENTSSPSADPRCPHCGDDRQIERTARGWFCNTCGKEFAI